MAYDFDKIARDYDRLNRIMTLGLDRRWRRHAVRQLSSPHCPLSALDVACGTGDMMVELARQGCTVTGVDLSQEMLAIARHKLAHSSVSRFAAASSPNLGEQLNTTHSNSPSKLEGVPAGRGRVSGAMLGAVSFQLADAEHLPFEDATFDIVTCAFGIRNFVHLEQGLCEMLRVLKPGGHLLLLEMATPDSPLVRPLYNLYARRIIPLLGHLLAGNRQAYTYLPASIERFPKGSALTAILQRCGFDHITHHKYTFGVCRRYMAVKQ